ncbi:MBL fold metallo-hydrolase [Zhouia amylolytica]|uniref:MBL fold metallo-hydrolase n=1 Tax=Zhouia amylolytica TaxID=376730 RepID=UPI0020CCC061|nr:MBL fold metallo-hydrolase [Zhouia amylolytica]MCQ0112774.1 MBL fold metallo-hydrolase [Zhouia amylolytica]
MNKKQCGAKPSRNNLETYSKSKNWQDSKFQNLEETTMSVNIQNLPKLLYKQFCEKQGRIPEESLEIIPFDKEGFLKSSNSTKFIWYGHSAILMRIEEKSMLIDPMLGCNAAPISPFPIKRFSENTLNIIDSFPEIDVVLISHDHYDHLDYDSIVKLIPKVKQFYVALGVARHLIKWGVPETAIIEFDWWDSKKIEDTEITFTPTRHFSGRGISDRAKSLWGGWAFKTTNENIWFSGDGGYGNHFEKIGKELGPFDVAFMECGQYNENWQQIHMFPEESVQAAVDAKVNCIMAVHWAGFALAQHNWQEPVERFTKEASSINKRNIYPKLGELVDYKTHFNKVWWK